LIALGASDLKTVAIQGKSLLDIEILVRINVKVLDKDQRNPPLSFQGWRNHVNEASLRTCSYKT